MYIPLQFLVSFIRLSSDNGNGTKLERSPPTGLLIITMINFKLFTFRFFYLILTNLYLINALKASDYELLIFHLILETKYVTFDLLNQTEATCATAENSNW